jgi:hypothetical protein
MVCDGFLLPRPLSPMKHALAAVVQHLGGVLPPHLGYAPARQLVTHDWLWSVGAHPLSWTAGGTSYAQVGGQPGLLRLCVRLCVAGS